MNKFFVPKINFHGDMVTIDGEDVKHIYKVLRLQEGDEISLNNCEGKEFIGEISEIDKKQVIVKIKETVNTYNESPVEFYLFQGLPKSGKMDLIVQKATELGVKEITPILTERVVVKGELGDFKKAGRWNKIALEACKQSKRSLIPVTNTPMEFSSLISKINDFDLVVVPYENENGYGIKKLIQSISEDEIEKIKKTAVIIGPEGGFEEEEINQLKASGAYIVTLGPRILRTETAGFVCISLLGYELGDLGGGI